MRYERTSNAGVRYDDNNRVIHTTGRHDISPTYSIYLYGDRACVWCHANIPHSTDAHVKDLGKGRARHAQETP
jgi:hypothetical protein